MTKVLITGGAEFIGYHLARHLSGEGQQVTLVDHLREGKMDEDLKDLCRRGNILFVDCDLSEDGSLEGFPNGYDYVYHFEALKWRSHFLMVPQNILRANLLSTLNVLDWFVASNSRKILFASSSEAYVGTARRFGLPLPTHEDIPLTVDDIFNPLFSYAGGMIAGELLFIDYARIHNFPMSIIRYHDIYGPRMGYEHLIPQLCLRVLRRENPFQVQGNGHMGTRCYVDDAVLATKLVMETDRTNAEVVNIGADRQEATYAELANIIFDISGFHPAVEMVSSPEPYTESKCPDLGKLKRLTGYEPCISLEQGLRMTYSWYEKHFTRAISCLGVGAEEASLQATDERAEAFSESKGETS